MNPDYDPDDNDEQIITVFKKEGRVNPLRIRELTGIRKQYVNDSLRDLKNAGWITKINRGLYEYNGDPRDDESDGGISLENIEEATTTSSVEGMGEGGQRRGEANVDKTPPTASESGDE